MAATYILGPFRLDAETDSAAASPALTLGRSPGRKTSRTASRRLRIRRAGGRASMPTRRCRAKRHHLCSVGRNYCLRVRFRGSDAMRFRSIWAVGTRVIATATIIGVAKLVLHDNREAAGRRCHPQVSVEYLGPEFPALDARTELFDVTGACTHCIKAFNQPFLSASGSAQRGAGKSQRCGKGFLGDRPNISFDSRIESDCVSRGLHNGLLSV